MVFASEVVNRSLDEGSISVLSAGFLQGNGC